MRFSLNFFSVIVLTGCAGHFQNYLLQDGSLVRCKTFQESECGVYLGDCDDRTEYFCQHNLEVWNERKQCPALGKDRRRGSEI